MGAGGDADGIGSGIGQIDRQHRRQGGRSQSRHQVVDRGGAAVGATADGERFVLSQRSSINGERTSCCIGINGQRRITRGDRCRAGVAGRQG